MEEKAVKMYLSEIGDELERSKFIKKRNIRVYMIKCKKGHKYTKTFDELKKKGCPECQEESGVDWKPITKSVLEILGSFVDILSKKI